MKIKIWILTSFLLAMSHLTVYSQTKMVEKVTRQGDELVIPYEKYVLPNGLTLIVHEDHSDPLVHVDVTYHVGSAREEVSKSGFAHFFEHMMFQGSENVADEEHFKVITEAGGTLNGSTNRDRTNYYETVPANQLELMLWLEADRMGFLLDSVTQRKFEVQRSTVKNEKGQNYDNRPYGRFSEVNAAALYPFGHPYSWLTIGKLEDLDRVDVNDLKSFFMRWYGPNNATVTVGGDVNPKDVVKMVEKYFGSIPKGPEVEAMKLDAVKLDQNRYVSYVDKNIRFPALIITYPTVPTYNEDEAALDCLADILGSGKSSYFYKKFVETGKAIQANVSSSTSELSGEFTMFVLPFPGTSLSDFETQVNEAIAEFEKNGVSENDITKFKAEYESNSINRLASVSGKVSQLAAFETYTGNPNQITKDLARYTSITKADVMRVYEKYIKGKFAVVQSVLPEGMESMAAKADDYTPIVEGKNPFPITNYEGLTYNKAKDNFDRKQKPVPGQAPLVTIPKYWESKTTNGIKIIGTQSDEIPTVTMQFSIEGGQQLEANMTSKAGVASLTASMMNESTKNFTSEQISEELSKIGSSIGFYSGSTTTIISVQTLKKNLTATLNILKEKLFNPKFAEEDFERLKKQQLEGAKASEKQPIAIAERAYETLLYGENSIRSLPVTGTESTIGNITLEDVKNFYAKNYSPSVTQLVVVGDLSKEEAIKSLEFIKQWEKKDVKIPTLSDIKKVEKSVIYIVDKKGAPQSEIRIGYRYDQPYDATGDYFKTSLMNYPLGGAFNSRINLNLREDKGYTYGARSGFSSGKEPGSFTAAAGVRSNVTDSAVVEFLKEMRMYHKDGISDQELNFMKKSIGQRDAREYETPFQKASFLNRILTYNLKPGFITEQKKIIDTINKKEIDAFTKKYLDTEKMNILIVGDKETILPGLQRIGYKIVELDVEGKPIVVKEMENSDSKEEDKK